MTTLTVSHDGLTTEELAHELHLLGERWSVKRGPVEELHLRLPGMMMRTGKVAAFAGALADELDHHPRIVLEHGGLTLEVRTHDSKAITVIDLVYAARLEQWIRTNGFPA
jgi:pterin-4a-carbinolamine dehydratase